MSSGQIQTLAVESIEAAADHKEKRGFFVEIDGNGKAAIVNATTDLPYGVILDGEEAGGQDSIAVSGGNAGPVRVKVGGPVSKGGLGQLENDGSVIADSGAGARVIVCKFLEAGVEDELVKAIAILPDARS